MKKRLVRNLSILAAIAASIWYFNLIELGTVYHDGVCGAQKWERHFFGLDLSENDYDEFGIEERWKRVHGTPCRHIWIRGTLESDAGAYWPRLHLEVAQGIPISKLERLIASTPTEVLKRKDRLGRTVLHWLVIHPDIEGRQRLIDKLLIRGLSLDEKDDDGLSPRDWSNNENL